MTLFIRREFFKVWLNLLISQNTQILHTFIRGESTLDNIWSTFNKIFHSVHNSSVSIV
jgi:hypothetical protein